MRELRGRPKSGLCGLTCRGVYHAEGCSQDGKPCRPRGWNNGYMEATREVRVFCLLRARLFAFCALSASEPTYVGRGETMATRACSLMPIEADEVTDEEEETEEGTVWGDDLEVEEATKLEPPILNNPLFKLTFEQAVSGEYEKDDKWLSLILYLTVENIEDVNLSDYERKQILDDLSR